MYPTRVFYALSAFLPLAVFAQPAGELLEPVKTSVRDTPRDPDALRRREMLRASLRSQPQLAQARDSAPQVARQMSDQERADLRQQLRRQ